ncbi:MAG: hypothetical protein WCW17_00520 [Patescibacteria group bacterium]|jgi:hypothetical protein
MVASPLTLPADSVFSFAPEKIVTNIAKIISALEAGKEERDIIPPLPHILLIHGFPLNYIFGLQKYHNNTPLYGQGSIDKCAFEAKMVFFVRSSNPMKYLSIDFFKKSIILMPIELAF